MFRPPFFVLTAGLATLLSNGTVSAGSDITAAAIATGRLYVLGKTEHPRTPVMLDEKFRTESDETGKFSYELIYHPDNCIVSAYIDGGKYQAVVSNCGQNNFPGTWLDARPAVDTPEFLKRLMNTEAELPQGASCQFKKIDHLQTNVSSYAFNHPLPIFASGDWVRIFTQIDAYTITAHKINDSEAPSPISLVVSSPDFGNAAQPIKVMSGPPEK